MCWQASAPREVYHIQRDTCLGTSRRPEDSRGRSLHSFPYPFLHDAVTLARELLVVRTERLSAINVNLLLC